jgi:hypothetical protein
MATLRQLAATWLGDHEYEDALAEWSAYSGPAGEELIGCPLSPCDLGGYPAAIVRPGPVPEAFWRCTASHGERTRFVLEELVKGDATRLRRLLERAAHG